MAATTMPNTNKIILLLFFIAFDLIFQKYVIADAVMLYYSGNALQDLQLMDVIRQKGSECRPLPLGGSALL